VRYAYDVPPRVEPFDVGARRNTSIIYIQLPPLGRLEVVKRRLRNKGFLPAVVNLLVAGSRKGTLAAYDSAWRSWEYWCVKRRADPLSGTLRKPYRDFYRDTRRESAFVSDSFGKQASHLDSPVHLDDSVGGDS
jgi:hypothetical protein